MEGPFQTASRHLVIDVAAGSTLILWPCTHLLPPSVRLRPPGEAHAKRCLELWFRNPSLMPLPFRCGLICCGGAALQLFTGATGRLRLGSACAGGGMSAISAALARPPPSALSSPLLCRLSDSHTMTCPVCTNGCDCGDSCKCGPDCTCCPTKAKATCPACKDK